MHRSNPNGGDQSKVQPVACGLLPFTCRAPHYGSPPYFLSPPWLTKALPFTIAHSLLHPMNMTEMRMRRWALGTSTITRSFHQPPAATSGITTLSFNGALRDDVCGPCGLCAHGPINTSVQCVRILSQSSAR